MTEAAEHNLRRVCARFGARSDDLAAISSAARYSQFEDQQDLMTRVDRADILLLAFGRVIITRGHGRPWRSSIEVSSLGDRLILLPTNRAEVQLEGRSAGEVVRFSQDEVAWLTGRCAPFQSMIFTAYCNGLDGLETTTTCLLPAASSDQKAPPMPAPTHRYPYTVH